jgi:hypothetical protein
MAPHIAGNSSHRNVLPSSLLWFLYIIIITIHVAHQLERSDGRRHNRLHAYCVCFPHSAPLKLHTSTLYFPLPSGPTALRPNCPQAQLPSGPIALRPNCPQLQAQLPSGLIAHLHRSSRRHALIHTRIHPFALFVHSFFLPFFLFFFLSHTYPNTHTHSYTPSYTHTHTHTQGQVAHARAGEAPQKIVRGGCMDGHGYVS